MSYLKELDTQKKDYKCLLRCNPLHVSLKHSVLVQVVSYTVYVNPLKNQ